MSPQLWPEREDFCPQPIVKASELPLEWTSACHDLPEPVTGKGVGLLLIPIPPAISGPSPLLGMEEAVLGSYSMENR